MAVGDTFVQGVHEFTILSENPNNVGVEYVDNGDTSYNATLDSTVNYDNKTWNVTSMYGMFYENHSLTSIDFSNVDTSKVTNMEKMFYDCSATTFNLLNVDTSNVMYMNHMFNRSRAVSLDLLNFDFSKVRVLNGMFQQCFNLVIIQFPLLDLSEVTESSSYLFYGCNKLTTNLPIIGWNQRTSAPSSLFKDTSQPISIQIISDDMTSSEFQKATQYWTSAAAPYSNVYLTSAPTTAPIVSGQGRRGIINSQDEFVVDEDEGRVIEIELQYTLDQTGVPVGEPNTIEQLTYTEGATPTVASLNNNKFYINLSSDDEAQHNYTIAITDSYNNTGTTTIVVPGVFAMLDFYAGGKGMAIGKPATRNGLEIQFPTAIGEGLNPAKTTGTDSVDLKNYQLIVGKYNEINKNAAFIVGTGTGIEGDINRYRNAFVIDYDGNINVNQDISFKDSEGTFFEAAGSRILSFGDDRTCTSNSYTFTPNSSSPSGWDYSKDGTTFENWEEAEDQYLKFEFDYYLTNIDFSNSKVTVSGNDSVLPSHQIFERGEYTYGVENGHTYLNIRLEVSSWLGNEITDGDTLEIVLVADYYGSLGHLQFGNGVFTIDNEGNTAAASYRIGDKNIFDILHPIDSIYMTSSNVNPRNLLGFGSWKLIDKGYKYQWIELDNVSGGVTWNSHNTRPSPTDTSSTGQRQAIALLHGNSIEFRFRWWTNYAISDNEMEICTIPWNKVGISGSGHATYGVGSSDAANAVFIALLTAPATESLFRLRVDDWIVRDNLASDQYRYTIQDLCLLSVNYIAGNPKDMIDSFCDKFYWKRVG